jgi:hypothetical protein
MGVLLGVGKGVPVFFGVAVGAFVRLGVGAGVFEGLGVAPQGDGVGVGKSHGASPLLFTLAQAEPT